jgi:hypothetical protein
VADQPQEPVEKPVKTKPIKPRSAPATRHSPPPSAPAQSQEPQQEHINHTSTPNERTVQPNGETERLSVLTELEEGVRESKRPTERYSFEIYTDMKEKIEDIQYLSNAVVYSPQITQRYAFIAKIAYFLCNGESLLVVPDGNLILSTVAIDQAQTVQISPFTAPIPEFT